MSGLSSLLPDYVDRNLHGPSRSSVLKPVYGISILGPAYSQPIVRGDSISMVSDRSLEYVDDAWSVFMMVNRAENASWLDGHHTHSKLAPGHSLDLRAKVDGCKQAHRNTLRLRCRLFVTHRALLSEAIVAVGLLKSPSINQTGRSTRLHTPARAHRPCAPPTQTAHDPRQPSDPRPHANAKNRSTNDRADPSIPATFGFDDSTSQYSSGACAPAP